MTGAKLKSATNGGGKERCETVAKRNWFLSEPPLNPELSGGRSGDYLSLADTQVHRNWTVGTVKHVLIDCVRSMRRGKREARNVMAMVI